MEFSPDWKHDPNAAAWHDFRNSVRGRTGATHKPWVQVNRIVDTPYGQASIPVVRSNSSTPHSRASTVHGAAPPYGAQHDEEYSKNTYRNGFAWSQHDFPGGHQKAAPSPYIRDRFVKEL